jgi:hypothetical protein
MPMLAVQATSVAAALTAGALTTGALTTGALTAGALTTGVYMPVSTAFRSTGTMDALGGEWAPDCAATCLAPVRSGRARAEATVCSGDRDPDPQGEGDHRDQRPANAHSANPNPNVSICLGHGANDNPVASARPRDGQAGCSAAGALAPSPIGQLTPVPPRPQYPHGFLCKYCW